MAARNRTRHIKVVWITCYICGAKEDMGKSELLSPLAGAWIPVIIGGLTGFVALLYQEDG